MDVDTRRGLEDGVPRLLERVGPEQLLRDLPLPPGSHGFGGGDNDRCGLVNTLISSSSALRHRHAAA